MEPRNISEFRRYFFNTAWMLSEKVLTLGLGLLATVIIARYLGPEDFGFYSYAISLVSIINVFVSLGLTGIVVKEIKNHFSRDLEVVNTVFTVKLMAALTAYIALCISAFLISKESLEFYVISIVGLIILFHPAETFSFWFQANVKGKPAAVSQLLGSLFGNSAKIFAVIFSGSLIAVSWAHVTHFLVAALLMVLFFFRHRGKSTYIFPSFKGAIPLLKKGSWVFLGSISAVVYLKIDQVMIQSILGSEAVGVYAAASRLSEAWYFIPSVIMASLFPKLLEKRKSNKRQYYSFIQISFDFLFLSSLIIIIIVFMASDWIIRVLYGSVYSDSALILSVHVVAACFVFMRAAVSKWILAEEMFMFSLITQGLGALSNVILNFFLIRKFGPLGAAWATLVSYSIASYFSLLLLREGRLIFFMMTRTFIYSWWYTPMKFLKRDIK